MRVNKNREGKSQDPEGRSHKKGWLSKNREKGKRVKIWEERHWEIGERKTEKRVERDREVRKEREKEETMKLRKMKRK